MSTSVNQVCKNYFNGFRELGDNKLPGKTKFIAFCKVASYFLTLGLLPLAFALTMAIDKQVHKKTGPLDSTDDKTSKVGKEKVLSSKEERANWLLRIGQSPEDLKEAPEALQNDRKFVLEAVAKNGSALEFACEDFKNDKEIVLAAVKCDGTALKHAHEDLRNNEEIVLAAIIENGRAILSASDRFKNQDFVLKVLTALTSKYSGHSKGDKVSIIRHIIGDMAGYNGIEKSIIEDSKEIQLFLLRKIGDFVPSIGQTLKEDRGFMIQCAEANPLVALNWADKKLKENRDFCIDCVKANPSALKYVPKNFQDDPDVLAAAKQG